MSIRSSVRSLTLVALSLGTTSVAFARNPPSLVQAQQQRGHAAAVSGYRDSLARAGAVQPGRSEAAGYRDSLTRFANRQAPVRIASSR